MQIYYNNVFMTHATLKEELLTMHKLKLNNCCLLEFKIFCNVYYKYVLKKMIIVMILVCFKFVLNNIF